MGTGSENRIQEANIYFWLIFKKIKSNLLKIEK